MLSLRQLVAAALIGILSMSAQPGDLDPPGPPASTLGPEPRIAINQENTPGDADSVFKITEGGSYFLTGNVTAASGESGIEIAATGVTLDLNGFEMAGAPGTLDGVVVTAGLLTQLNVVVRNGTIRSWGGDGVDLTATFDAVAEDLMVAANGGNGISGGLSGRISRCTALGNSGRGISVPGGHTIAECSAVFNTGAGIAAGEGTALINCAANSNGSDTSFSPGFFLANGSTAVGCAAMDNSWRGFSCFSGNTLTSCQAGRNAEGISLGGGGVAMGCSAWRNDSSGICSNGNVTVDTCSVYANGGDGISVDFGSSVTGCHSTENTGHGISVSEGGRVLDSFADGNGGDGINVRQHATVSGCTSSDNAGDGIRVQRESHVVNNLCQGNSEAGVHVTGSNCRIDGNSVVMNARGIDVDNADNLIVRNSASWVTQDHYGSIVAGNEVGTIQTSPVGAGPWDNFEF